MKESVFSVEKLIVSFQDISAQIVGYLPKIVAAIVILVVGWLLAKFLRVIVAKLTRHLDNFWHHLLSRQGLETLQSRRPPTRVVSEIFYWLTLLVFLTLATQVLGLDIFVEGLKQILAYFPLVLAGLLIMMVGFVVSSLVGDVVASASASAELLHGELLARSAQLLILFIAIILGIEQIGISTTFLSVVAGIFLATMLGGFALAFGLGARTHVSNIISANQLQQLYQVGDKIRIADIEGRISNITASRIVVDAEAGSIDIPAKLFDEQVSVILEKGG